MSDTEYRPLGILGTGVALLGTVLVLVAFTGLDWLEPTSLAVDFPELRHATAAAGSATLAAAYFSWLGWLLLAASAGLALAANVPSRVTPFLRAAGTVVGLGAALATVLAIKLTSTGSLHGFVTEAAAGYWFAVVGFVVLAVGAVLGVSRRPRPLP